MDNTERFQNKLKKYDFGVFFSTPQVLRIFLDAFRNHFGSQLASEFHLYLKILTKWTLDEPKQIQPKKHYNWQKNLLITKLDHATVHDWLRVGGRGEACKLFF